MTARSIWIGFDSRESAAFAVTRETVRNHAPGIPVAGIVLERMRAAGLYWRQTETRGGRLWDTISEAPMATSFAISRFLTPHLARSGWALFLDADMLVRGDLGALFGQVERDFADKAIVCVKHDFRPTEAVKMDNQAQVQYPKKGWSAFAFFNCDHPANRALTLDLINEVPGRNLHAFCWIEDEDLIGGLPVEWNWLVGHSDPQIEPKNVHFTDGFPLQKGYETVPFSDEWRERLYDWAEQG